MARGSRTCLFEADSHSLEGEAGTDDCITHLDLYISIMILYRAR